MAKPFDDITKTLQDAVYVSIGLGVIAFQKLQVQRQELQKSLETASEGARSTIEDNLKLIEERLRSFS